jgi:hypothetical protein
VADWATISSPLPGGDGWLTAAARHWYLDAPAPR